ncbi:MAG: glycosyltransferase family 2 protein [Myxococcota bacterium]
MIDLTIVIVSYETSRLLSRCLERVQEACQFCRDLKVETIVVDNGSRDDSVRCAQQSSLGPRVISLVRNRGFAAAVNCGLRARRGRQVLLLNSDVEIDRELLSRGVQILDDTASAGVLGAALFHPDGRSQRSIHALPDLISELVPEPILRFFRPQAFGVWRGMSAIAENPPPREVEAVRGAVFFIQGETLRKVGLFDEDYFFFLEETDYCWRVRAAGQQVLHCGSLRSAHRLGASSKRRVALATRIEFHRSLYHFLDRRRGRGISWVARVARVLRTVVSLAGLLCLSMGSLTARRRMAERWGLLLWHLQGRPDIDGLAQVLHAHRSD